MASYSTAHRNVISDAIDLLELLIDAYDDTTTPPQPSDAVLANVESELADARALLS